MLLTLDIGNTQTVIGLFDGEDRLFHHWRISTVSAETSDEKAAVIINLLAINGLKPADIGQVIISSVVPACTSSFTAMSVNVLNFEPFIVDNTSIKGLNITYKHPHEIGADRLVNSLAGYRLFGGPLIIVDFGTATTFDVVTKDGNYIGGAISPGVETSADALFAAAAKLSRTTLAAPKSVIGDDTAASLQSGIVYGAASLVDGMVERIKVELQSKFKVIATGGLAELIGPHCRSVSHIEPFLTLIGLQMVFNDRKR